MILGLTKRQDVQYAVWTAVQEGHRLGFHETRCDWAGSTEEADERSYANTQYAFLLLDLHGTVQDRPLLVDWALGMLYARRVIGILVIADPVTDYVVLRDLLKRGGDNVIDIDTRVACTAATWLRVFERSGPRAMAQTLRTDVQRRLADMAQPERAGECALRVLELAYKAPVLDLHQDQVLKRLMTEVRARSKIEVLLAAHHLPKPKELVTMFRLLWFKRLQEDGWKAADTARFLRFTNTKHQMRYWNGVGIHLGKLRTVPYERVLDWVCYQLSIEHTGDPKIREFLSGFVAMMESEATERAAGPRFPAPRT